MSHTPGPWKWWTSNSWRRLTCDDRQWPNQEGGVLCPIVCRDGHPDVSVSEEDMGLIAAAPDLLAALKKVVAISDRKHDAWDEARAAIAKAETPVPR